MDSSSHHLAARGLNMVNSIIHSVSILTPPRQCTSITDDNHRVSVYTIIAVDSSSIVSVQKGEERETWMILLEHCMCVIAVTIVLLCSKFVILFDSSDIMNIKLIACGWCRNVHWLDPVSFSTWRRRGNCRAWHVHTQLLGSCSAEVLGWPGAVRTFSHSQPDLLNPYHTIMLQVGTSMWWPLG